MAGFSSLSRVTESSITSGLQASIQDRLQALAAEERRISSGKKFSALSDSPLVTRRLVSMELLVQRSEKFESNIGLASSRLSATESSLAEMENLIIRGREIALTQINASATDQTRANSAVEVGQILEEMVGLANEKFGERYLFGGHEVHSNPFERVGEYVAYRGDDGDSFVEISAGMFHLDSVSGVRAFGAYSAEVRGREDLDPRVTMDTSLVDLNGGRGFRAGVIEVRDGTDRMFVDLSQANTVGDVVDAINATGFATVGINTSATALEVTKGTADLSILDVNGGKTATDLGIAKSFQGVLLSGDDLDPVARVTSALADLRAGAGITAGDFTITNGNLTATIDTTGMDTLEEVINAINRSGTEVFARLNADRTGIDVISTLSGAPLTLEEGTSTTAGELGLIVPSDQVRLDRLNAGTGISSIDGDDFRITLASGAVLDVDIASAGSLGEIAALINDHPENGGLLLAEVVATEDRLRLTELSGAPGELEVTSINGAFTADNLGILGASVGGVLEGRDLDPGAHRVDSVFEGFALLTDGLLASDERLIGRALDAFDVAEARLLDTRAQIGTSITRLEISARRMELEVFETKDLMSREGDTDLAETIIEFNRQESVLQASLQTAARILQQSILDFLS